MQPMSIYGCTAQVIRIGGWQRQPKPCKACSPDSGMHVRSQVIRGYSGDGSAKPVFEGASPFNVLGTGYQRPFELATLRLRNMVGILPECAAPQR